MYENVVVGTDGSESSWQAVLHAAQLAALTGASLHVVQGCPNPVFLDVGFGGGVVPPHPSETVDAVRESLARRCGELDQGDAAVEVHVVAASGADAVVDVAEQTGADVIVVGSKGMTGAKRYVLGSVPNAVSHHAPCSVLIVRTS